MLARKLNQKPHIGANFKPQPKSARERAVDRWFIREKSTLSTTTASDKTVPGQYFDSETNLHYNRYRYYDPSLGRYITSDPLGLKAGLNTYTYVNANPIYGYDIDGLFDDGGKSGIGIGGTIPVAGIASVSGGIGVEMRVCCNSDNKKMNEVYLVIRGGIGFGLSAGFSGPGRGNTSVSVGGLPSCMNPDIGEELKMPLSVWQIRLPLVGGTIDFREGRGDVGLGAQAGASVAADIYNRRILWHQAETNLPCECEDE